jgi:hypothetical protein
MLKWYELCKDALVSDKLELLKVGQNTEFHQYTDLW